MNNKGFTLIEVIIAILILSISTLVVIAMQTSTLRGYRSIRDTDEATTIAHRTADLLHINALQWRDSSASGNPFPNAPYIAGTAPFENTVNPLDSILTNPWQWQTLSEFPVNAALSSTAGGRHCIYVRGGLFGGVLRTQNAAGVLEPSPAMQAQIVVVSAGSKGRIASCVLGVGGAPYEMEDLNFNAGTAGADFPLGGNLEIEGFRPTYYATMIFQRTF